MSRHRCLESSAYVLWRDIRKEFDLDFTKNLYKGDLSLFKSTVQGFSKKEEKSHRIALRKPTVNLRAQVINTNFQFYS